MHIISVVVRQINVHSETIIHYYTVIHLYLIRCILSVCIPYVYLLIIAKRVEIYKIHNIQ